MIPEKGKCLCNKGCVRVGNLTEQEATDCQKQCRCDNCSDDIRKLCYKQFIIDNDTSPYGFGYSASGILNNAETHEKESACDIVQPNDEYAGKLLCNFGCKDGICDNQEDIQRCKDLIVCDTCRERKICLDKKRKGLM